MTAIYAYTGAACAVMLLLALWLGRHWRASWVALVVLLAGALLLTPAYPANGSTLAPALIVAAFEFMTGGYSAAQGALRPLAMTSGAATLLALLLGVSVFRRRPASSEQAGADAPPEGEGAR